MADKKGVCASWPVKNISKELFTGTIDTWFDSEDTHQVEESASLPVNKKKLFIGGIDTLFGDEVEESAPRAVPMSVIFNDGADDMLNEAVDLYERRSKWKPSLIPENMQHFLQNTKKEQDENKFKAMIRLRDTKTSNSVKRQLEEWFFPIKEWPLLVIRFLLGDAEFDYSGRLCMATFFHGNGFKNKNKAEWLIKFYNKKWQNRKVADTQQWNQRFYKFRALYDYLDKANDPTDFQYQHIRSTYYYYNLRARQTMFYDGWVRTRSGQKIPYI